MTWINAAWPPRRYLCLPWAPIGRAEESLYGSALLEEEATGPAAAIALCACVEFAGGTRAEAAFHQCSARPGEC